jgi:hypothetical protein
MAGRGPAMPNGWVYIMTNRRNGTLYIGVTGDLIRRVWEHREGISEGFIPALVDSDSSLLNRHGRACPGHDGDMLHGS